MAIDFKPEQNDYTNLTPFKTWLIYQINTWGVNNFPFLENDFDQLTNYGMMMKLMKAMNDTISNQNKVEDDMSKLYGAFTELQTYINNYFDNLDVQEEINNKLDEMVEDGVLEQIIEQYLNSSALWCFNNVNEMKQATNLIEGSYAKTLGYYSINDGGGATYKIRKITNEDIIDNAIIIPVLNPELIAEINDNIIYPEMMGAKGDGINDDTIPLQSTFKKGRTIIFGKEKTYLVKDAISIFNGTSVEMSGSTIEAEDTSIGNHLFHNFLYEDTYLGYNGNGNILLKNGNIKRGSIDLIHGKNILFENISFEDCRRDHYLEICACKNVTVRDCSFKGMTSGNPSVKEYINIDNCKYDNFPWLDEDSVTYDGTIVDGVFIDNCTFDINNSLMEDAVGKHTYYNDEDTSENRAKNITILNSSVYGATNSSFRFLGADNIKISNCYSYNSRRLFAFADCENIIVDNNKNNVSENSSVYNVNNIKYTNNETIVSTNSWDLQLKGTCDSIDYSFNKFTNTYGRRTPLSFQDNENLTITDLGGFNNNYSISGEHGHLIVAPSTANTITFGKIDNVSFNTVSSSNTLVNDIFDLTQFNRLIVQIGALSSNNYQEVIIKSYTERNFRIGETYYFPVANGSNNSIEIGSITITDAHTLTCSHILRYVNCQNLSRS